MKALVVLGTRPEVIKLAPVVFELRKRAAAGDLTFSVCATAQHRGMLDQALSVFGITPDDDLDIMQPNQSLNDVASHVFTKFDRVLQRVTPDRVIVQGDTTTAAAAAIAAFYRRVSVAHVEAGLRTHTRCQPFPEEINRRLAAVVAETHFAPTASAKRNLIREGVDPSAVQVVGNTGIDALMWVARQEMPAAAKEILQTAGKRSLVLVTAHRRENAGAPLERICEAIRRLVCVSERGVHVVFPVHPNPAVSITPHEILRDVPGVQLLPPLEYRTFVHILKNASAVLTDSGGIQEEAPALAVPVVVLRDVTERPEALDLGLATLVSTNPDSIAAAVNEVLTDKRPRRQGSPFGDGNAARRVVAGLLGEHVDEFDPALVTA